MGHPGRRPRPGRGETPGRALRRRVAWTSPAAPTSGPPPRATPSAQLFLAAASHRRPITDVLAWLASPADRTPVDLLTDAGHDAVAAQLQGTVGGATGNPRRHLRDRAAVRELPARPGRRRLGHPQPSGFPSSSRPRSPPPATPCTCSARTAAARPRRSSRQRADAVMRAAVVVAERSGGRLDPPALCVLDEAANVCKISRPPRPVLATWAPGASSR